MSTLNEFTETVLDRIFRLQPDLARLSGLTLLNEQPLPRHDFADYSEEGLERRSDGLQVLLSELNSIVDCSKTIDEDARIDSAILEHFLEYGEPHLLPGTRAKQFRRLHDPVVHLGGAQTLPQNILLECHPFKSRQDVEAYIASLQEIPRVFAQLSHQVETRVKRGLAPADFAIDAVIDTLHSFVFPPPSENLLTTNAQSKLRHAGLSVSEQTDYLNRIVAQVDGHVYPSYLALIDTMKKLRLAAGPRPGLVRYPDGSDYYSYLLKLHTTTDLQADEIHAIGLEEIAKVHNEINKLLDHLGFGKLSPAEAFGLIQNDERFRYKDSAAGRANIVRDLNLYLSEITEQAHAVFDNLPPCQIGIRAIPKALENTTTSSFSPAALDGSSPGVFNANLKDMLSVPGIELPTITYHEAIPGHGLQISVAQELSHLPSFRRVLIFNAYAEGWAKYAEMLPFDLSYNTDPYAALGRLRLELYSTVNLALDTGIHAKGWSHETGVEFFRDNAFVSHSYAMGMVNRIAVDPGQTCSYKIGMIKMLELKQRMKTAFGPKFSLKQFHSAVLENGSLPLSILDDLIDRKIEEKLEYKKP